MTKLNAPLKKIDPKLMACLSALGGHVQVRNQRGSIDVSVSPQSITVVDFDDRPYVKLEDNLLHGACPRDFEVVLSEFGNQLAIENATLHMSCNHPDIYTLMYTHYHGRITYEMKTLHRQHGFLGDISVDLFNLKDGVTVKDKTRAGTSNITFTDGDEVNKLSASQAIATTYGVGLYEAIIDCMCYVTGEPKDLIVSYLG